MLDFHASAIRRLLQLVKAVASNMGFINNIVDPIVMMRVYTLPTFHR